MRLIGTSIVCAFALLGSAPAGVSWAVATAQEAELGCVIMNGDRASAAARSSPLDSVSFSLGGSAVKICYGSPSVRGRQIFGGLVSYDQLWRTGANEPTMIHTSVPLSIAGIRIEPGTYSLYTVPGKSEWKIIVNASVSQWGHERSYTEEVRAKEVGQAKLPSSVIDEPVEKFTIRVKPQEGNKAEVILEWERTRVTVPVSRPAS